MNYNTQNETVLNHLMDGPITPMEAFECYRISRLAACINSLRNRGYMIETKKMRYKNSAGRTVNFAKYELTRLREEVYATA